MSSFGRKGSQRRGLINNQLQREGNACPEQSEAHYGLRYGLGHLTSRRLSSSFCWSSRSGASLFRRKRGSTSSSSRRGTHRLSAAPRSAPWGRTKYSTGPPTAVASPRNASQL